MGLQPLLPSGQPPDCPSPQPTRWGRNRLINVNHYANKKSAAESMLDIALLMANASQLKAVIDQGPGFGFYVPLVALISISLVLQISVGVLLIFLGMSWRPGPQACGHLLGGGGRSPSDTLWQGALRAARGQGRGTSLRPAVQDVPQRAPRGSVLPPPQAEGSGEGHKHAESCPVPLILTGAEGAFPRAQVQSGLGAGLQGASPPPGCCVTSCLSCLPVT